MAPIPEIPPRVRQLAGELAQPQPMRRGSVSDRTIKCGKVGCACAGDPNARHGPYYSLTWAVEGKTHSQFLTAEQAAVAKQQIAAGREFRQQVDTYWEACQDWADTQMDLTSAASSSGEAKKKGSKRTSKSASSRKSKRS